MTNLTKAVFDTPVDKIRHQLPTLLSLPLLALLSAGCMGPQNPPPGVSAIFASPPANTVFSENSATIAISRSAVNHTTICYTTDDSTPVYADASCTGGTTAPYVSDIDLSCESEETGVVEKTVRIAYMWDGTEQFSSASYSLTCSVPSNITVFKLLGTGEILGGAPGTLALTGFAQLNRDTGILSFKTSNTSITNFSNITTTEEGSVSGQWTVPVLDSLEGLTTVTSCINNGGLFDGCVYVAPLVDVQSSLGITLASDPITFNLNAGGVTEFSTSVDQGPPVMPVPVTTNITYTLTALDVDEELPTYTVAGTVNGLINGTLVLTLNDNEQVSVIYDSEDSDGVFDFTFTTALNDGEMYSVTVHNDPTDLSCEVSNGVGTIAVANVNNISITCSDPAIASLVFEDADLASCVSAAALGLSTMSELTTLNCSDRGISSASGLEVLSALTSLNLSNNQLTSIDISNLTQLTALNLSGNTIGAINLTGHNDLISVNVSDNWLTQLDTSSNGELLTLVASINPLKSIALTSNAKLKTLVLGQHDPEFTSIDLSENTALSLMLLLNLNLTEVDLTTNTALTLLLLWDLPALSSIDLTTNTGITHLQIVDTNLLAIDISTNTALTNLNLSDNQLTTIDLYEATHTSLDTATLVGNNFDPTTVDYLDGLIALPVPPITNLTY